MGHSIFKPPDVRPRLTISDAAHRLFREAGSEGVEMVMWHVMRGALDDDVEEIHRHYHVPASNTAVRHIILENKKDQKAKI